MAEQPTGWRVVVIAVVLPIAEPLIATVNAMGHDVVAWLTSRRPKLREQPPPPWGDISDRNAPQGVNLLFARDNDKLVCLKFKKD